MKKIFVILFLVLLFLGFTIFKFSGYSINKITTKTNYTKDFNANKVCDLYKENKYEEAEKIVLEYLKKHPNDIWALSEKAYISISKGQNEEGIILLDKLLLIEPDNDVFINNKSWAYNNLGLFELALNYAEMGLKILPVDEYDYVNKGNALYGLKKYEEALKCYDLSIRDNNKFQYAYYGKGLCLKEKKEYVDAFLNFKKSYEISPTDDDYFNELIDSSIQLKKYNDVIQFCDERINISSKDSNAYYYKAEAYAYLNQYENALRYFDESIKYSDYHADALYEKCKLYLKLNNKDKAYENLTKALIDDEEYLYYINLEELKSLKGYKDFDKLTSQ